MNYNISMNNYMNITHFGAFSLYCMCFRTEKEKAQLKTEVDEAKASLDHISKSKVRCHLFTTTYIN